MTRQLIIVEDDASMRRSLARWGRTHGCETFAFGSALAFLACDIHVTNGCLILDVGLPDIGGGELKRRLIAEGRDLPTVFITALADEEVAVALRGIESPCVLRKPFDSGALEAAVSALS